MLLKDNQIKNKLIIFFSSITIFFWGEKIYNFDLRLSIFFLIPILIFDYLIKQEKKKIIYDFILLISISSLLILHSLIFGGFDKSTIIYKLKVSIGFSFIILVIKNYYEIIISNFQKINLIFLVLILLTLFIGNLIDLFFNNGLDKSCIFGCFSKNRFIFKENSHFGLMASVILINSGFYIFLKKNNFYRIIFLLFLIIIYFNYSTTLYASIFSTSVIVILFFFKQIDLKQRFYFLLLIIISMFVLTNNFESLVRIKSLNFFIQQKFLEKAPEEILIKSDKIETTKSNKSNKKVDQKVDKLVKLKPSMSTEIFINSFYISSKAIISNPFGYGINGYREAFDKHHKTSQTYTDRFVNVLNREDGSNNLAKIITEFGLFSIVFFVYSIILFFSKKLSHYEKILFISFILPQTIIRGVGYFNAGFIIILFCTYYLHKKSK